MTGCARHFPAFRHLHLLISRGRLILSFRHNQYIHQKPTKRRRQIDHERVHQKFTQVFADGLRSGRVRCAEVDEKDAGLGHRDNDKTFLSCLCESLCLGGEVATRERFTTEAPSFTEPRRESSGGRFELIRNHRGPFENFGQSDLAQIISGQRYVFRGRR